MRGCRVRSTGRTSTRSTTSTFDEFLGRAAPGCATSAWPRAATSSRAWETENEEGLRGAYDGPRSATGSSTATASPARCCSRTPTRSPAARHRRSVPGSRRPTSPTPSSRSPARARTTGSSPSCARHNPARRAGVALVPITHDVERAVAEIEWAAANGLRGGILVPTMWRDHAPYHDPVYDPVWAACARHRPARCTRTPAPRRRTSTATTSASTSPRSCGGRRGRCGSCCSRARSNASRADVLRHRERRVLGQRPHVEVGHVPRRRAHDQEDGRAARGQGDRSSRATTSARTSSSARRR